MITLKNKEIESALIQIAGFNDKGQMVSGLLTENISLGLKRRLQKIHADLVEHYKTLQTDSETLKKECEDAVKLAKEMEDLNNEEVKIDREFVSLEMIEAIQTTQNYDFELIEKIAQ